MKLRLDIFCRIERLRYFKTDSRIYFFFAVM